MSDAREEWEFYPCRVDDAPASVLVDLAWSRRARPDGIDTLYASCFEMADPDEHGMGSRDEAEQLYVAEDEIVAAVRDHGLVYVGRLRNNAIWQLTFMGPPERRATLEEISRSVTAADLRPLRIVDQHDPSWSYFDGFLMPDRERMQWIQDRRVVDTLTKHGDTLTEPRRVDHWAYFRSEADRDAFCSHARERGFETLDTEASESETPYGAQLRRQDSVRLEDIHELVMILHDLADDHRGHYDGWETRVVKP